MGGTGSGTVDIQRAGAEDWRRVRDLRLRALRDAPDAFWFTAEQESATTPQQWRDRLERPDAAMFVARLDGVDVGIVVGAPHYDDGRDAGLYGLWVAPEARGRGVARALVDRVVAWARAAGYPALRLEVGDHNTAAIHLYERAGFTSTGYRATFPPPRDHITEHERALQL